MKRRLFSKFKDYNYILDKVLEDKNYSEDAKNLLLNMIYKIEVSYKDYAKIKVVYMKQNTFIDEIIKIISDRCKYLFLIDPKYEEVRNLKEQNVLALTDERQQRIYAYPTELAILYGIIDINPKYFYIPNKYYYIKNQFQRILVQGTILDCTEVIRNFNGWSWNVAEDMHIDTVSNMIYQSIRLLIDEDFLRMWEKDTSVKIDFVNEMRKEIEEYYGTENSYDFYLTLSKLIISSMNKDEKEQLKSELKKVLNAYDKMKDKNKYISTVSEEKRKLVRLIEKEDILLNDEKKLRSEYVRINNNLSNEKKYSSINAFLLRIKQDRHNYMERINEINDLVIPENYTNYKNELSEKLFIMSVIREKKELRGYKIDFLKTVISCLGADIDKISSKEEVLDIIYKIRYFRKIRVTENEKVEDIPELWNEIRKILKFVVTKGCKEKFFNIFCNDIEGNFSIFEIALDSAIPDFEDIDISVKFVDKSLEVTIYDNEVVDKQQIIDFNYMSKDLTVREGKHIPMYSI